MFRLLNPCTAEKPHKDIHTFVGNISVNTSMVRAIFRHMRENPSATDAPLQGDHVEPLSAENTLWTNTVIASGNAVGMVMYTGIETRAVMNTNFPSTKVGQLDLEINRLSKVVSWIHFPLPNFSVVYTSI